MNTTTTSTTTTTDTAKYYYCHSDYCRTPTPPHVIRTTTATASEEDSYGNSCSGRCCDPCFHYSSTSYCCWGRGGPTDYDNLL